LALEITTRDCFKRYVLRQLGIPLTDFVPIETEDCSTTGTTGTTGSSGTTFECSAYSQLDFVIDDALEYFQNYGSDIGNEKTILFLTLSENTNAYNLPDDIVAVGQPIRDRFTLGANFDSEESAAAVGLFSFQGQFGPRGIYSYLSGNQFDNLITMEMAEEYASLIDLRYSKSFQIHHNELSKTIHVFPTPTNNQHGKIIAIDAWIKGADLVCYNHIWVRRYTIALAMIQIGTNLSMYDGFTFPTGGTFNASYYIDKGEKDRERLEDELASGKYGGEVAGGVFLTG
jgi:hypothetical protein